MPDGEVRSGAEAAAAWTFAASAIASMFHPVFPNRGVTPKSRNRQHISISPRVFMSSSIRSSISRWASSTHCSVVGSWLEASRTSASRLCIQCMPSHRIFLQHTPQYAQHFRHVRTSPKPGIGLHSNPSCTIWKRRASRGATSTTRSGSSGYSWRAPRSSTSLSSTARSTV